MAAIQIVTYFSQYVIRQKQVLLPVSTNQALSCYCHQRNQNIQQLIRILLGQTRTVHRINTIGCFKSRFTEDATHVSRHSFKTNVLQQLFEMSAILFDTPLTTLGDRNNIGGAVMSSDYDSVLQHNSMCLQQPNSGPHC